MLSREFRVLGPVMDVEMTDHGKVILIDILVDEKGKRVARDRSLESVLRLEGHLREEGLVPSRLTVRRYFDTPLEAMDYCHRLAYPTDGIVAVCEVGMHTAKIKATRSLELEYREGTLRASDKIEVGSLVPSQRLEEGSIIELRVTGSNTRGQVQVDDMIVRKDKVVANSSKVCGAVIDMCTSPSTLDPTIPRRATDLCFVAREVVYRAAISVPGCRLIVDVGTGRGQSLGVLHKVLPMTAKKPMVGVVPLIGIQNLTGLLAAYVSALAAHARAFHKSY